MEQTTEITVCNRLNIISTELKLGNGKKVVISSLYRSHELPKTEFVNNLETYLLTKKKIKNHIVVGDFNIDILSQDTISMELLSNFLEKGYTPFFTGITRPSENNNNGTCIDNFYIKTNINSIKSLKLTQTFTDHYPLIIDIDQIRIHENTKVRNTRINFFRLKNIAQTKNWDLVKYIDNPNIALETLINEIQICVNLAVKTVKTKDKNKPRKGWITVEIIKSIKTKEKLYKNWKKIPIMNY